QLAFPFGIAIDGANAVLIADTYNSRIRKSVFSVVSFTVTNGGATSFTTTGDVATFRTGYGRIQTTGGSPIPTALAIFSYRSGGSLISEVNVPATLPLMTGRIYAEVNGPVNTGVAIANPNNQTATINFFFTDATGNNSGSGATTIAANQQIAR